MPLPCARPFLPCTGLAPAFSAPLPLPACGPWVPFPCHSLATTDTSLSAATCTTAGAGMHSGPGRQAAGVPRSPGATCHSPLLPPPELGAGLGSGGGGGLEVGGCCSLDGDLELETMHSLMDDSRAAPG